MPNTLKIKRGVKTSLPTLAAGEPGWCTDTHDLFIGDGTVNRFAGSPNFSRGGTLYKADGIANAALNIVVWRTSFACVVKYVKGYRVGGTGATVNARKNGTLNLLASALSLTSADEWMDGGAVQNENFAVGDKLEIMIVSTAGAVTQLAIQVDFVRV